MNRVSESPVLTGKNGKLLVINRTEPAETGNQFGVARIVNHQLRNEDTFSLSTNSKFESIMSSEYSRKRNLIPSEGPRRRFF